MADPTNYLGEVMVHKASRKIGPIMRVAPSLPGLATELTLNTHDGQLIRGAAGDFELANPEQYLSFVEGWLADCPMAMY